jgi:hypothetical protein
MNAKEKIYYLIREFKKGNYDINIFCDEVTNVYNLELNFNDLSELEKKYFSELIILTSRYSPYENDLKIPNAFFNDSQVRVKVDEIIEKLHIY